MKTAMTLHGYGLVRVINLPERTDRRRQMVEQLASIGLEASFLEARRPGGIGPFRSIGEHGVFLSHLLALQEAREAGQSVLILEDDCDFTPLAREERAPSDLLWGGFSIPGDYIQGAHCMGFSAATAARLVPYLEDWLRTDDAPPIDGAYLLFCRANPDIRVDACDPPIAVQRPSHSDIAGRRGLDRIAMLRPLVGLARRAKRLNQTRIAGGSFDTLRQG
jgi:glycosyl transferase family 25